MLFLLLSRSIRWYQIKPSGPWDIIINVIDWSDLFHSNRPSCCKGIINWNSWRWGWRWTYLNGLSFEIMLHLQSCKNSMNSSYIPLTQLLMSTSCIITVKLMTSKMNICILILLTNLEPLNFSSCTIYAIFLVQDSIWNPTLPLVIFC